MARNRCACTTVLIVPAACRIVAQLRRAVTRPCLRGEQDRRLGCNRWRSRGRDRTPNLDGDSPKPSSLQECRKSAPQCRKNTLAWHRRSPVRVHATVTLHPATTSDRMTGHSEVEILLVEDNPSDVELTLRALKARNLANQVFVARGGAEGLEFFFGEGGHPVRAIGVTPRVILLDLKLPKVDGLEVLRRLKSDERTRTLPVVVLTSSKEEPDIAAAYRLGANSYIVKPVDFEAFARAVSDVGLYWVLLNELPR